MSKTDYFSKHELYSVWNAMVQRCTNPKQKSYRNYGGRGIKVCQAWLTNPCTFYTDMGDRPEGHTIERIDSNQDYSPENCVWLARAKQAKNTSQNVHLTFNGQTQILADWATEKNIPYKRLHKRIKAGWSIERALTEPPRTW